ncbi:MAG: aspartate carbamoyltransferase regulatory subunit [Paramuribaculum sp.]|nr:aspartate carbamoyltransferase regulatory subunit [Bacteroidales bacterium]MBD5243136.1 aspartate carbamoyltransferase regulatory subunit [Barnesiella sp.]MDE7449732.1 aspartate carbamoyltransferase regulatory subunit [Paramuribaculum sp.]
MNSDKKALAVAALRNGTVIDHIPSRTLFKAVKILGIEKLDRHVTIGNNLDSKRYGTKGIIKVADIEFPEAVLNRIAIIAPRAKVNIIRDYEVVEKHAIQLPQTLVDLVKCANPKCITNNEPMHTRFEVVESNDPDDVTLKCRYCGQTVKSSDAIIE